MGQGDMETAVSPQPVPLGPRSAVWLLPRGGYGAAVGHSGEPTLPPGCHRPCPAPLQPLSPQPGPHSPPRLLGCVCVALNPPNYSGRRVGNKKQDGGGERFIFCFVTQV